MDENKPKYIRGKYSEGQKIATAKYNKANYDRIILYVKKGVKAEYAAIAEEVGMSLNSFINAAITDFIKQIREQTAGEDRPDKE